MALGAGDDAWQHLVYGSDLWSNLWQTSLSEKVTSIETLTPIAARAITTNPISRSITAGQRVTLFRARAARTDPSEWHR